MTIRLFLGFIALQLVYAEYGPGVAELRSYANAATYTLVRVLGI